MKIILSPTKKMRIETDSLKTEGRPVFLKKTEEILETLKRKDFKELKKIWACNEKLVEENMERLHVAELYSNTLTPAILAYEGLAFQYMSPKVFSEQMLSYVEDKLRILSGFYGVLKPFDAVVPYRLEMQAKLRVNEAKDLYAFWGDDLYREIAGGDGEIIINLASKEYSKCVEAYLTKKDRLITCHFGELKEDRFVTKGTYAKMARGEAVRFMAENQAEKPEELKGFKGLGYRFHEGLSTDEAYYFVRE